MYFVTFLATSKPADGRLFSAGAFSVQYDNLQVESVRIPREWGHDHMPRTPRTLSEIDIYHVYVRGVGRHILFEDDADRQFFLEMLGRYLPEGGSYLAWALMTNHVHLLIRLPLEEVSKLMKLVEVSYAQHFNSRYGRVGHLFQGRFGSEAIRSDEQLLVAVRYIHRNPVEGGLSRTCEYPWSSYGQYLQGPAAQGLCDTAFVLDVFGSVDEFCKFHAEKNGPDAQQANDPFETPRSRTTHFPDAEAIQAIEKELGPDWRTRFATDDKKARDGALRRLKAAGLSVRQIERLTGIGRGIVARA